LTVSFLVGISGILCKCGFVNIFLLSYNHYIHCCVGF